MVVLSWDADVIDDHGGIPELGDEMNYNGKDFLVTKIGIINERKVEMKLSKMRFNEYNDSTDPCLSWKKIDDKYLPRTKTNMLENGLGVK